MLGKLQPITVSTLTLVFSALLLIAARHAQAQTETVLYNFTGGSDGHGPISNGNLVFDSKGNLYGTTTVGGSCPSCGTVFELIPSNRSWEKNRSWKNMVLYSFTGFVDGDVPGSGLVFDSAGNLYGTTEGGGVFGQGTVFELSPNPGGAWTETVLYSFKGLGFNDGATPFTPVILDQARNIYGTNSYGGTDGFNGGIVFELTQSGGVWSETILYGFSRSGNDGRTPNALVMDKAGNLYGTTVQGGAYGLGTAFEMSESNGIWTESVIYSFRGLDGDAPYAGVTFDQTGNLYGTTAAGGRGTGCPAGCGTVFELSPSRKGWAEKVLHNFKGGKDGSYPYAGVTLDAEGNLYGTTSFDGGGPCQLQGVLGCGTVFILKKSGKTWTKQVFRFNGDNGAYPQAGIVLDKEGNLYGTTIFGGSGDCSENEPGCGLVFEVNPSAAVTTTTVSSSPNPSTYGQAVTFTAVVTSSAGTPPEGETISFEHGKTVLGTGALSSGSASFTTSTLKVGTTAVTAVYGGDFYFLGSKSNNRTR
jgi:uncharacterized repeat protein (TIGR03803 family)